MKNRLMLGLICSQIGILLCWSPSAQALAAKVKIRTAFCQEAKTNCLASFYLTPSDRIRIEGQSADGKWLRIRHLASNQTGWVLTADIQLQPAGRLQSAKVMDLESPALALVAGRDGVALIRQDSLVPLNPRQGSQALLGLDSLQPEGLRACLMRNNQLRIYGEMQLEKERFLSELEPGMSAYPHYQTLMRLGPGPHAVAWLPEQILLLMGAGDAGWGQAILVGLDTQYLPVLMLRQTVELQNFLPVEVRSGLRIESLRLQDLEPDGTLTLSAYHSALRRDVLVRVRPHLSANWDFLGQYYWPRDLPFRPDVAGLKLRLWHAGEQTFLLVSSEGASYLIFYAGGSEPLTQQKLETPILDAVLYRGQLWSLEKTTVTRWQPVEAEAPAE